VTGIDYYSSVVTSVMTSSMPVATVLHSSNGHGDVTTSIAIGPYIRSWTRYPLLLPQSGHNASRDCVVCTVDKNLRKEGGGIHFIF
jgi:hypothetical protein